MFSVVLLYKSEDFDESFFKNIFKFLIDFDSFNDVFITFPNYFKSVSKFFDFFLFSRLETRKNNGWTGLFTLNIRKFLDNFNVFMKDILFQNRLEFSVPIVLQYILEWLRILSLGKWSVRLEYIFDAGMFVVIEGKLDKFILSQRKNVQRVFQGAQTRIFFSCPSSWNSYRLWRRRGINFPHQQLQGLKIENKLLTI